MMSFVDLSHTWPASLVGNKFAHLCRIAPLVEVPPAICVTVESFQEALGKERLAFLESFFADLRATLGCFLLETTTLLTEQIDEIALSEQQRQDLVAYLQKILQYQEDDLFAVRSSGVGEDSETFSFAGVYQTTLNVQGFDRICQAILVCWKAYYSYSAIAARIRANQYDPFPGMAVILQKMIAPQFAGVAFTHPGNQEGVVIEYIEGSGEHLVSGIASPRRYPQQSQVSLSPIEQQVVTAVQSAASLLKKHSGYDVDIEWAWDGQQLHILQVRPITRSLKQRKDRQIRPPLFSGARLYLDTNLPPEMDLGECREIYVSYVSKRAKAYRLVTKTHIATGAAHVLTFNWQGLHLHRGKLESLLAATPASQVVLDVNTNIRQVILQKAQVFDYLCQTFRASSASTNAQTIIIRDFIQGNYGFISRLTNKQGLLIEYAREGLLSINRGLAHCERISITNIKSPLDSSNIQADDQQILHVFLTALPDIISFTYQLDQEIPGAQLEWVLENGIPYFVDFSQETDRLAYTQPDGIIVISSGTAQGNIYRLDDQDIFARLSIGPAVSVSRSQVVVEHYKLLELIQAVAALPQKPIIFVQSPYAILSVFFEHVAGFIFAEGSLLCHLAILLREMHIPALICPHQDFGQGEEVVITDAQLTVLRNNLPQAGKPASSV